jgi:hypothetical protein
MIAHGTCGPTAETRRPGTCPSLGTSRLGPNLASATTQQIWHPPGPAGNYYLSIQLSGPSTANTQRSIDSPDGIVSLVRHWSGASGLVCATGGRRRSSVHGSVSVNHATLHHHHLSHHHHHQPSPLINPTPRFHAPVHACRARTTSVLQGRFTTPPLARPGHFFCVRDCLKEASGTGPSKNENASHLVAPLPLAHRWLIPTQP